MAFKDPRDFLGTLEREGELLRIKEKVDWDLEAGAIGRRAYERQELAILFERIKDYPQGYRILNGMIATFKRLAIAFDLDPNASVKDIQREYERRIENPIIPNLYIGGSCTYPGGIVSWEQDIWQLKRWLRIIVQLGYSNHNFAI